MRNPSTTGYEGVANLEDAFIVAANPAARDMGTLVVLNDEINSAREVTKTDARLLSTFSSRDYGVLGTVFDRVAIFRKPVRRHSAKSEFDAAAITALPRVDVILTYQGAPGDLIKSAVDNGAKGVVIAGAGAGALSGTQNEGVSYATEKGAFVVTTTRTGSWQHRGRRRPRWRFEAHRRRRSPAGQSPHPADAGPGHDQRPRGDPADVRETEDSRTSNFELGRTAFPRESVRDQPDLDVLLRREHVPARLQDGAVVGRPDNRNQRHAQNPGQRDGRANSWRLSVVIVHSNVCSRAQRARDGKGPAIAGPRYD